MDKQMFAKRLRRLLRTRRKTVKQLADEVGVSRNTMYGWLKGAQLPQTYFLTQLKRSLECEWDELLGL